MLRLVAVEQHLRLSAEQHGVVVTHVQRYHVGCYMCVTDGAVRVWRHDDMLTLDPQYRYV